jgi:hypothetical protein
MMETTTLRKAMHDIAKRKGDFTLFGLFMRSDAPGTWDLVVSAPWLEKGKLKATSEFVELLSESIGEQALSRFSRIQTIPSNSPGLKAILRAFSVDDGEVRVQNSNLFGLQIEDAFIFRSKPAADERRSVLTP